MFGGRKSSQKSRLRPHGKLTIDTACVKQKKVFPYESRVQQLSFVGFEESKARKDVTERRPGLKEVLENDVPVYPGPEAVPELHGRRESIHSSVGAIIPTPSNFVPHAGNTLEPPTHKRSQGRRPSPLDLKPDVSPSDRAIPIGISVSPNTVSSWERSPPTAGSYGKGLSTPTIVITPAKEHFPTTKAKRQRARRVASSVYSRHTNCMARAMVAGRTPPVPPLPLFAGSKVPASRFSDVTATTTFEEDLASSYGPQTGKSIDEIINTYRSVDDKRMTAGLPTPRRSKGWWNIITSPFSARSASASNGRFPSDSLEEISERVPVLRDVGFPGNSFTHDEHMSYDDETRSAPPCTTGYCSIQDDVSRSLPRRSHTSFGNIDRGDSSINMYRTPSTGEAAAYYDKNRNFPSLCIQSQTGMLMQSPGNDLRGWSPSNSVYRSPLTASDVESPELTMMQAAMEAEGIASTDHSRPSKGQTSRRAHFPHAGTHGTIFSTPSADEMKTPATSGPVKNRGMTQTTNNSIWSPLSATPEVKNAYIGMRVGPRAANGGQRQVDVERTPTMQTGPGLAAGTITHSRTHSEVKSQAKGRHHTAKVTVRPAYGRQDSYGLGISDSESELSPPPARLDEKPRLRTDRFGQLVIRTEEDDLPKRPWYRRYFWLLAASIATLLLLLIILLVVLIPQKTSDVPVEASWLNLTGFPAMAIGVSTIIQPNNTVKQDKCVSPNTLWSCEQPSAEIPNFRIAIRFRNGTLPGNETMPVSSDGAKLKRRVKRDSLEDYLYTTTPSAPSTEDQQFLGRTTDNTTSPYNGEETPFYISFLDAIDLTASSSLQKRDDTTFQYPYPTNPRTQPITTSSNPLQIPSLPLLSNHTPTPPNLYPLPLSQPLRLQNRNLSTEHYSFYTYFSRSLYISTSSTSPLPTTNSSITPNPASENATAICTFSQTRFHVHIWTRRGYTSTLFNNNSGSDVKAKSSTANTMVSPGSFPYPVTLTLDRHGGEEGEKGVFCYGLGEDGRVRGDAKGWVEEERGVGGELVNGEGKRERDEEEGEGEGIDGGTGGCMCQWSSL